MIPLSSRAPATWPIPTNQAIFLDARRVPRKCARIRPHGNVRMPRGKQ